MGSVTSAGPGRRRTVRAAALLGAAALSLLGGCVSQEREQEMGDIMAAEINAQLPLLDDPVVQSYIDRMGATLASVSERPRLHYRFYIIDSEMVNAFALPGGHIYLTRGLLEKTRTAPELAGVVAHEVGHVAARHGVQKMERQLRTGSLMSIFYQMILGGEPELLRRNSVELAGALWNASNSREDEEEADRLAVEYLLKAGVDPGGVVTLLETLMDDEVGNTGVVSGWFSTHPMTASRIEVAREEIEEESGRTTPEIELQLTSYSSFLRRIEALPPPPAGLVPPH